MDFRHCKNKPFLAFMGSQVLSQVADKVFSFCWVPIETPTHRVYEELHALNSLACLYATNNFI